MRFLSNGRNLDLGPGDIAITGIAGCARRAFLHAAGIGDRYVQRISLNIRAGFVAQNGCDISISRQLSLLEDQRSLVQPCIC